MALITAQDLATFLRIDYSAGDASLSQAATLGCGLVTSYTNQVFETATYTQLLPIDANRTIRLPQRPVTDVTSVTVAGAALTEGSDWDWDGITPVVVLDGYTPTEENWQATVVYVAGYAAVPAEVKAVALAVGGRIYNTTPGVSAESVDDYRVTYADNTGTLLLPGEMNVLRRYRQRLGSVTPTASVPTRWQAVGVLPPVLNDWRWQG